MSETPAADGAVKVPAEDKADVPLSSPDAKQGENADAPAAAADRENSHTTAAGQTGTGTDVANKWENNDDDSIEEGEVEEGEIEEGDGDAEDGEVVEEPKNVNAAETRKEADVPPPTEENKASSEATPDAEAASPDEKKSYNHNHEATAEADDEDTAEEGEIVEEDPMEVESEAKADSSKPESKGDQEPSEPKDEPEPGPEPGPVPEPEPQPRPQPEQEQEEGQPDPSAEEDADEPVDKEKEEQSKQEDAGAAAAAAAAEAAYSTRGRSTTDHLGVGNDPLERLAREALGDLMREKPPSASSLRESFLSDSITEEERRTRSRYIPAVEGMHALRKPEVKGDLALARTNFSSAGVPGTVTSLKSKGTKRGANAMDIDEDDGVASADDDRGSDIVRVGTKTVEVGSNELILPSAVFLPPPTDAKLSGKAAPNEVEYATAFNPPRPPESIGPKKRHRTLRWERRPADIEGDLNNYRRTVHRTREELKNAQEELDRLEAIDDHLRRDFLTHLQCMGEEWKVLNKELAAVQQECVNAAELLTSRTRSRGASKSSYAMRDVLTILRARGQEVESKNLSLTSVTPYQSGKSRSGLGGVGAVSLDDWDCSTVVSPAPIASAWVLPGDVVDTPFGEGTVISVQVESKLHGNAESETNRTDTDERGSYKGTDNGFKAGKGKKGPKAKKRDEKTSKTSLPKVPVLLAPRVAVRLPYGVGYFLIKSVVPKEDPSTFSDARLAARWKGLIETASEMGSVLDIEAMAQFPQSEDSVDAMDVEEERNGRESMTSKVRLLPFGAGLFPTGRGRGGELWKLKFEELDKIVDFSMFHNEGVLGKRDNTGVTAELRKYEDDRQDLLNLRAQVLQLKNELYRQRRVRMLNDRAYAAGQERAMRTEALVAEMRTDLTTLKRRLDEEISELGISEHEAELILSSFYQSFDAKEGGEVSLEKRQRRMSRLDTEDDDLDDDEEEQIDSAVVLGSLRH